MAETAKIGKDWLWPISEETVIVDKVFVITTLIYLTATLVYVIWRNHQSKYRKDEEKLSNLLWYATVSTITAFTLNQLSSVTMVFETFHSAGCMNLSTINTILYFGSKFFLWVYGIARLYEIFHKSGTLAYKLWFLKAIVAFYAFEIILINILHNLFDDATSYYGICAVVTADFIPGVMAFIDVATNIFNLWLFYRKMRLLWKMVNGIAGETVNDSTVELAYIIRKYTVLTGFSALSTILLGASVAITPIFWTFLTLDSTVNVLCLMLYDKRYDHIYQILCCCCAKRAKFDELINKLKMRQNVNGKDKTASLELNQLEPVVSGTNTPRTTTPETDTKGISYGTQHSNLNSITIATAASSNSQQQQQQQLSVITDVSINESADKSKSSTDPRENTKTDS